MLLNIHIAAIFFSIAIIVLADREVLAWLRGSKPMPDQRRMQMYHYLMWAGLSVLIVTGFFLFFPMRAFLLSDPLFVIKLLLVGILVINAILVGRLMPTVFTRSYASLTWHERMPLFASGAISVFSWTAVIVIGLYLFY